MEFTGKQINAFLDIIGDKCDSQSRFSGAVNKRTNIIVRLRTVMSNERIVDITYQQANPAFIQCIQVNCTIAPFS